MQSFSRLANTLINNTRFLNVNIGLKLKNDFSKNGGNLYIDASNPTGLPTTGATVYGSVLDACKESPITAKSIFSAAKDAGADKETLGITQTVWNLCNPKHKVSINTVDK